jgi:hypothetical protein
MKLRSVNYNKNVLGNKNAYLIDLRGIHESKNNDR